MISTHNSTRYTFPGLDKPRHLSQKHPAAGLITQTSLQVSFVLVSNEVHQYHEYESCYLATNLVILGTTHEPREEAQSPSASRWLGFLLHERCAPTPDAQYHFLGTKINFSLGGSCSVTRVTEAEFSRSQSQGSSSLQAF